MGVSRRERYVSTYAELSGQILAKGLLERRYAYYWVKIIGTTAVFVGVWVVFALLGNSWFQLVVAAVLAVVLAQFGFLGHDAAHRQIFASHRWNEWTARVVSGLFTGLSYGWWLSKHNRHHANPNKEGADPTWLPGLSRSHRRPRRTGADSPVGWPAGRATTSSRCCCWKGSRCTSPASRRS